MKANSTPDQYSIKLSTGFEASSNSEQQTENCKPKTENRAYCANSRLFLTRNSPSVMLVTTIVPLSKYG